MTDLLLTVCALMLVCIADHVGAIPHWFGLVILALIVVGQALTMIRDRSEQQT
jgi:phosphatidylglycerophosphate synthase